MRASRLLSIVLLLQARGRMTANELATALGVSARTIYRDMLSLHSAGIPVLAEPRRDGGYRLVDGYQTRLTGITNQEAQSLFLTGVPAAASALGLADAATVAELKLLAAVPAPARARAERARQRVHVDPTPWGSIADPHPWLLALHQAVWNDKLVRIRYGDTNPRRTLIAPLGLVCKGTSWYLVALRGKAFRTYRVSRIHDLVGTDTSFERPADFDLVEHWHAASNAYADSFPRTTVVLRVRGGALDRVGWVQARSKTVSEPDTDGWADVELVVEDETNALVVLGVLGNDVVVVEPAGLRRRAVAAAQSFAAVNSEEA